MKEYTAIMWMYVAKAVAVSAAVGVACWITTSGWPLIGLMFAGTRVSYTSDDDKSEEKTDG